MNGIHFISSWLFITSFFFHPFHVSVCEIKFKPEKQSIEIIYKVFLDDLEVTLNKEYLERLDLYKMDDLEKTNQLVKDYLSKKFRIKLDGKKVEVKYLGLESDGDSAWIYMEIEKVKQLKQIEIYNALLLETYDDQVNIVHVRNAGKNRSIKMNTKKDTGKISF
jgi:hypothetical protein